MSIITISRGSYSHGKAIAEKVAQELGYECISRDVLIEASKEFNIPEIKLIRAFQDGPSILDRITYGKERYIAYIQSALLKHLQKDNVVYHGFAGHFFVKDITHVLKVRIIADMEDRVKFVMERDRVPRKKAISFISKIDNQRRKWSRHLYGIDTWDSSLYDIVLHIVRITDDEAVQILQTTLELPCFRTTPESQRALDDLSLAANVKAYLVEKLPAAEVSVTNGIAVVNIEASLRQEDAISAQLKEITGKVSGVKEIRLHIVPL